MQPVSGKTAIVTDAASGACSNAGVRGVGQ